jgi:hypothetical protein
VDRYTHLTTETSERFIDTIIDQLKNHVMQTTTIIGITDIHPGALAHGIKAFKDLNTGRIVILV